MGIIGSIQALEAIKVRLDIGTNLCGRLLMIDGLNMKNTRINYPILIPFIADTILTSSLLTKDRKFLPAPHNKQRATQWILDH